MANIKSGEYEVILRRKFEFIKGNKDKIVPYYEQQWGAEKTGQMFRGVEEKNNSNLIFYVELRKDIEENKELGIDGKRFSPRIKFYKTISKKTGLKTQNWSSKPLLEKFVSALGLAKGQLNAEEMAEYSIDKPIRIKVEFEDGGQYQDNHNIVDILPTTKPEIEEYALIDDTLQPKEEQINEDDVMLWDMF